MFETTNQIYTIASIGWFPWNRALAAKREIPKRKTCDFTCHDKPQSHWATLKGAGREIPELAMGN